MSQRHDTILAHFTGREPMYPKDLVRATGLSKNQIHSGLQRLKDKGRVVSTGDGMYRIADAGEADIEALPIVERAVKHAHPLHMVWF